MDQPQTVKYYQNIMAYMIVDQISESGKKYDAATRDTTAFRRYSYDDDENESMISKFLSKKGIFKVFDYDQNKFTFNAMLNQTSGKTMTPDQLWERGMSSRREVQAYMQLYKDEIKAVFKPKLLQEDTISSGGANDGLESAITINRISGKDELALFKILEQDIEKKLGKKFKATFELEIIKIYFLRDFFAREKQINYILMIY